MKRFVLVTTAVIAILVFVTCAATTFAAIVVNVIDSRGVEPVALVEAVEPTAVEPTDEVDEVDQQVDDDREAEPSATATTRPTRTPRPSATPLPSDTPTRRPTNTPRPTSTPRPSNTPQPTNTPTPQPSNTPRPTNTRQPSNTPLPTNTPTALPTATALPPSPTATPVPVLPTNTPAAAVGETAVVSRVIDGDTIEVSMNGTFYRVRYIGINTPELNEPCGREATLANSALVAGRTVRLVKDVSETDQYGRLLRYVYLGDLFVNAKLVADGWAEAVAYPPDTAFASYFESLEAQAVRQVCGIEPTATEAPPPAPPSGNCDPSYPTVCIPLPPPDLDCGDIPHRRFTVLPPDPHGFDGDNDGVGCESG